MTDLKILDCTLRDGGYYNEWNFDNDLINQYLQAMKKNNIAYVEIGLRSLINNNFKGVTAFCPDSFLDGLDDDIKYGVMVNGSELLTDDMESVLMKLFPRVANNTKVKLVRIACHFHEFEKCLPAVDWLKKNGFIVGFNLMQISERTDSEIIELGRVASNFSIDVLYFADSMGCMSPADVEATINLLRAHWSGEIGIHTHDNMGLALSNTIKAIDFGVTWVDSTVTGMGRGPGNTKTEELLMKIAKIEDTNNSNIASLFSCIEDSFTKLQRKYKWGKNEYYYLSGKLGIHPTYIQFMLSDERYDSKDIMAVINFLKDKNGSKFSKDNINKALGFYEGPAFGESNTNDITTKDILIVGTGPSVGIHKEAIEHFISSNELMVVALNSKASLDEKQIDYRIASHPLSIMADIQSYKNIPSTLITPYSMLPNEITSQLDKSKIFDYGIEINEHNILITNHIATIPNSYVLTYALAFSLSINPDNIYLVGFDGYDDRLKNDDNDRIFKYFDSHGLIHKLTSLTPTKYDIPCKSIYGLL